jgi:ligand-binding SRPBCC domain-containing protein
MAAGRTIEYRLRLFGIPFRWTSRIDVWEPEVRFVDRQRRGPYAFWSHAHTFESLSADRTLVRDTVTYRLPFGPLGRLAHPLVARTLARIFDYREAAIRHWLEQ